MDYKGLNDNELIYLCHSNSEEAINIMIDKYKFCILTQLKEYYKEYTIIGLEIADLYQEGLVGLLFAINSYDENKNVTFYTYANTCIRNNINSAMRQTFRKKNRLLNQSYSLDKLIDDTNNSYYEILKDESYEPTKILIGNEETEDLINGVKSKLSKNELVIFELRLKGLKNEEICELIGKDRKYVENTMYRINRKYKSLFN